MNKYYVYLHVIPKTSCVVYVGKGCGDRAWNFDNRSESHIKTYKTHKYLRVKIIAKNLTDEQAKDLEAKAILKFKPHLNKQYYSKVKDVNFKLWNNLVYYDINSPTFLKWKIDTGWNGCYYKSKKDSVAGSVSKYNVITYLGQQYKISRIVWVLFNLEINKNLFVDHLDGNTLNDCISNLRLVHPDVNSRNRIKTKRNKTGIVGVYLKNSKRDGLQFIATCEDLSGKKLRYHFTVEKFGYERAFELAVNKRKELIDNLNSSGAGYTKRHIGELGE